MQTQNGNGAVLDDRSPLLRTVENANGLVVIEDGETFSDVAANIAALVRVARAQRAFIHALNDDSADPLPLGELLKLAHEFGIAVKVEGDDG